MPTAPPSTTAAPATSAPLPSALAQPTSALPQNGAATGRPVGLDVWMPGNKQGVGTAFTYDQREIVDSSFLELVRLGLRSPNDPSITATLDVAEHELEVKTPKGELYRRYSHDGYGESQPGLAPDGHGNPWPMLVGEHSIYEVAETRSEHPASWYLPTMSSLANQGGMLPEQVFPDGSGTGSATPLAWAHAEYIVFTFAVKQERVPDMPAVVAERYLTK